MLAPEARHISTAVPTIMDFTVITPALDPLASTVAEPI
jgi:hypothetical protein